MFLRPEGMKRSRARYVATRYELKRDGMWSRVVSRGDDHGARTMAVLVAPKPVVFPRLASEGAQRERGQDPGVLRVTQKSPSASASTPEAEKVVSASLGVHTMGS